MFEDAMSGKKGYEIRIVIAKNDLDKLQGGEILQVGIIDLGVPMKVSLQKRKSLEKVAQATM